MSDLISGLAGAGGAANTAGGFYQSALSNEINAAGSPAAADFSRLQNAALRPEFQQQQTGLTDSLAAQGIASSGAGRSAFGNLAANQASTLAGVTAPLYQDAMNTYGQIDAQMPGAQEGAYNDAIQNFYQGIGAAGSAAGDIFGLPTGGGGGGGGYTPASQGGYSYQQGQDNAGTYYG
jgi:hypothetical protein